MIAVDTSALAAIFFMEPEAEAFLDAIHASGRVSLSAANLLESGILIGSRRGRDALALSAT